MVGAVRLAAVAALLAVAVSAVPLMGADAPNFADAKYQAITKPSNDVTVSFTQPGRIDRVEVSLGSEVKEGQELAHQESEAQEKALAIDEMNSTDRTEIDFDIAQRKLDEIVRDRTIASNAPQTEQDQAKMKVVEDQARIDIAESKLKQAVLKFEQSKAEYGKLTVKSPVAGIIAEEFLKKGESADGSNSKLVRIVQVDPLWVDVPVALLHARKLSKDDAAVITTSDGKELPGKIKAMAPVADAASGTILVRVEVPNKDKISAGENVSVRFGPMPVANAAAGSGEFMVPVNAASSSAGQILVPAAPAGTYERQTP